jgi:hypothetical protein
MGQQGQKALMKGGLKTVIMPPDKEIGEGQFGNLHWIAPENRFDRGLMVQGEGL